jgi:hypothetical protein
LSAAWLAEGISNGLAAGIVVPLVGSALLGTAPAVSFVLYGGAPGT